MENIFSEKKKYDYAYFLTWSVKQNSLAVVEHIVEETCKEEKKKA